MSLDHPLTPEIIFASSAHHTPYKSNRCAPSDEGAQRSFISAEMANELQISPTSTTDITVASFGTTSATIQKLGVATVEVEMESGELIPMSVLIVPSIAAPIQNLVSTSVYTTPHLRDLKLAHPITSDKNFTI